MSANTLAAAEYNRITKRVTEREVAAARLAPDYAALVAHFGLDADTDAETITDVARSVVLSGAAQAGTKTGASLTVEDLTGRDPGPDAAHRDYWKAARAVRAGLVRAIDKGDPAPKPVVLRVSLSGEGGGSAVIPEDHPLYPDLIALLRGGQA